MAADHPIRTVDNMTAISTLERSTQIGPPAAIPTLGAGLVDAYLTRLGVPAEPPSPAALGRLHRAHVERVPYETFWMHLDEPLGVDALESVRRIATTSGGGYCFQLNGAFAALLATLGYTVTRHAAGVHDATGPSAETLGNHVALIVHGLPGDDNPNRKWYVDAGLGDVLYEPLPLGADRRSGPSPTAVETVADGVGDWHFVNEPGGSLAGVSIVAEPVAMDVFAARHAFNVTSPTSSFRRTVTCQRRHATGSDVLRGRVLTRRNGDTVTTHTVGSLGELRRVLDAVFGLRLDAPRSALTALWSAMCARHDEYLTHQHKAVVAA